MSNDIIISNLLATITKQVKNNNYRIKKSVFKHKIRSLPDKSGLSFMEEHVLHYTHYMCDSIYLTLSFFFLDKKHKNQGYIGLLYCTLVLGSLKFVFCHVKILADTILRNE